MNGSGNLRMLVLGGAVALGVGLLAGSAGAMSAAPLDAGAAKLSTLDQVYYRGKRHRRYRDEVYFDDLSNFYPAVRGFNDRNPVPRGNMRGCTVDLGYGRYETCDK
jgi:hypothetical protein